MPLPALLLPVLGTGLTALGIGAGASHVLNQRGQRLEDREDQRLQTEYERRKEENETAFDQQRILAKENIEQQFGLMQRLSEIEQEQRIPELKLAGDLRKGLLGLENAAALERLNITNANNFAVQNLANAAALERLNITNTNNLAVQNLANEGLIQGKTLDLEGTKYTANKNFEGLKYGEDRRQESALAELASLNARNEVDNIFEELGREKQFLAGLVNAVAQGAAWRG